MSDLPADDDTTDWPIVEDDEPRRLHRGDSRFAGQHDDEPDVAEQPHPEAS